MTRIVSNIFQSSPIFHVRLTSVALIDIFSNIEVLVDEREVEKLRSEHILIMLLNKLSGMVYLLISVVFSILINKIAHQKLAIYLQYTAD